MNEKIEKFIKSGTFPPVLLLFGKEEYHISQALERLTSDIFQFENAEYNTHILEADDTNINTILNLSLSYPFMADRRCIVVKHFEKLFSGRVSKKNDSLISLEKYLDNPQKTTIIILTADYDGINGLAAELKNPSKKAKAEKRIDGLKAPFNKLIREHQWIEFPQVHESNFFEFIKSELSKHSKTASAEAIQLLLVQSGQTLREIANEIEKLVTYLGERDSVTVSDVSSLIGSSHIYNVYDLQKAISARNLSDAMKILEHLLAHERLEMLILTVISRHFIALWKLYEESQKQSNDYQLAAAAGINPYFINEYKSALKKYSQTDLDNAFKAMAEADAQIKATGAYPLLIMQKMILKIISK
ncbi:MAG: DNA polymerase III subunit delta [Candidatus Kapabacteria bacterium]|nr:DNA polymerase III subunit delta [Candidatus Kapabacteria bacterium]